MSAPAFAVALLVALGAASALAFSRSRLAAAVSATVALGLYFLLPPLAFCVVGTILLMIVLSTPLYVTLGALTLACFYFGAEEYRSVDDYGLLIERIFGLTDKNVLLAVPYFVLAGALMTSGGIADRIVAFAQALVGWLPGGLAATAVFSCMFFAAISGSSPVTVIAIGSILFPALLRGGYGEKFSLGLVTSAGSLGILIPPSIPMIVYAIVVTGAMGVDVAELFVAGVGPGLLIGAILVGYSVLQGVRRPDFDWRKLEPPRLQVLAARFVDGFWALLLPVIVLGGIYPIFGSRGLFTPTEAAAVAAVYAFVVGHFIHRELSLATLPRLLVESTVMLGSLLIIMVLSFSLNHFLVDQQIPDAAVAFIEGLQLSRLSFLLVLNVFLLLIGCLMDIMSAILVIAPLVAPIALSFGVDPLHLAIIFIVNLEIGYLTPPIGLNLFVSATLFDRPIGLVVRSVGVFTLLLLGGLGVVTWWEPASGGLVRVVRGEPFSGAGDSARVQAAVPAEADVGSEEADEGEGADGVDSIEELMRKAASDAGEEPLAEEEDRIKTIEELMREASEAGPERGKAEDEASIGPSRDEP